MDETNLYAFASETLRTGEKLAINAAVRFDHFTFNYIDDLHPVYERQSVSRSVVSPKLQLNYSLDHRTEFYLRTGIGFHSNDTRVVARQGEAILPKAYGADLGANFKIGDDFFVNTAVWVLDLDQEFVYVGDEGIVEPSGKTRRTGVDLSVRYQLNPWLYFDNDVNFTNPRAREEAEGADHIPLAPVLTNIGGLSFTTKSGFSGSVRYRYMGDRPANEDNSIVARGYMLLDAVLKYSHRSYEVSITAENLTNRAWTRPSSIRRQNCLTKRSRYPRSTSHPVLRCSSRQGSASCSERGSHLPGH